MGVRIERAIVLNSKSRPIQMPPLLANVHRRTGGVHAAAGLVLGKSRTAGLQARLCRRIHQRLLRA